jgi:ribosomal protein L11 methylase PrmA
VEVVTASESSVRSFLIRADNAAIAAHFDAVVPFQPIAWLREGLGCCPGCRPSVAAPDPATLPFTISPWEAPRVWPESAAALVAGWYRRTEYHAPAPRGRRELIQPGGDGFGPFDHPSTAMCLTALDGLPPGDAVDVGCGSGLLTQAWLRMRRGRILAFDADPAAVAQTHRGLELTGVAHEADLRCLAIDAIPAGDLAGRIIMANIPAAAHERLAARLPGAPPALVISGYRPNDADIVLRHYRRHGLRPVVTATAGGFCCHVMATA